MNKVLIYADSFYPEVSLELLEAAGQIACDDDRRVYLAAFHSQAEESAQHFDYLMQFTADAIPYYDIAGQAKILAQMQEEYKFDCILFPATFWGRMLAPRLAMRLKTGLVADVTQIGKYDEKPALVRPAFDGKIFATIISTGPAPIMASIRPDVFTYTGEKKTVTKRIDIPISAPSSRDIQLVERSKQPGSEDIRDSRVLISGGGGTKAYYQQLNRLAEATDGMVSASRSIVDSGIAPRRVQVGHSGKTVSPELYFAVGIYGAVQHVEGLKGVDTIISVNKNPNAPICSLSDIVVAGDGEKFIELLCDRIDRGTAEK